MILFMYYCLFLVFFSFVLFFFYFGCDYFIKILIFVELMMITLVLFYFAFFDFCFLYFVIYFLILSVCEGVLGLSGLVMLINWYSSDYLMFRNLLY